MAYSADLREPSQNRVGSWAEGMHPGQMTDGIRHRGIEQILSTSNDPELRTPTSTWTAITSDTKNTSYKIFKKGGIGTVHQYW
uniref:WGS project CBMG000000000 data, contig CS5907-c002991 n=1 Tax=Fusarium acuminatum CS5907 TaxID=1318461 RepID=A0A090MDW8_9HYPO|nr:unnamed protein product [Fusarium acuminatum CS5907]